MNRFFRMGVLLIFLALFASPVYAVQKAGVVMTDTVTVNGKKLSVNGLGVREATVFSVDVYVAGLYLEQRSGDAAEILASNGVKFLFLRFVRSVSLDDIRSAWADGIRKNGGGQYAVQTADLNSKMSAMKKGDSMSFTFTRGGVAVSVNGTYRGFVAGGGFARVLLAIWLGSDPPNSGLKQGLLGR